LPPARGSGSARSSPRRPASRPGLPKGWQAGSWCSNTPRAPLQR